jgi:ribosomal protein S18 acetylase RimI-like enzyme
MGYSYVQMESKYAGLAWAFHVSPDSCHNPDYYEQYLSMCAIGDYKTGDSVTHLIVDEDENGNAKAIAGYVSLRVTSLISRNESSLPCVHPSIEIAELAVSRDYERQGIGTDLVKLAVYIADELRERYVGIKYVVLCADPMSVGFYEGKCGLAKINDLYETPRDGWNDNCVPMFTKLPEL